MVKLSSSNEERFARRHTKKGHLRQQNARAVNDGQNFLKQSDIVQLKLPGMCQRGNLRIETFPKLAFSHLSTNNSTVFQQKIKSCAITKGWNLCSMVLCLIMVLQKENRCPRRQRFCCNALKIQENDNLEKDYNRKQFYKQRTKILLDLIMMICQCYP